MGGEGRRPAAPPPVVVPPLTVTFDGEGCAPTARTAAGGTPTPAPWGRGSYLRRRSGSAEARRGEPCGSRGRCSRGESRSPPPPRSPPAPGAAPGAEPRRGWGRLRERRGWRAGDPGRALRGGGGVSRPGLAPLRRTERAPAAGWKEGRREGGRPEAAGGPVRVVALRPRPERESPQALLEPR